MKIKLLLDVHLDPAIALALKRRFPELDVKHIRETAWAHSPDPVLLELLDAEGRVFVTRDVKTIPLHCHARLAEGTTFAGVILAESKRMKQTDTRGFIRRLIIFLEKRGNEDFTNRILWL